MKNKFTVYALLRAKRSSKKFLETIPCNPTDFEMEGDFAPYASGLHHKLSYTSDPDMITLDDDPRSLRINMPCGHSIGRYIHTCIRGRMVSMAD